MDGNVAMATRPVLTVLDDYQSVALDCADWSRVGERYRIDAVNEHLTGRALIERLADTEVLVVMRERSPLPRTVLEQLPALKLIVTAGARNAAIDVSAAEELGILVCGTRMTSDVAVPEMVLGMIIALARDFVAEHEAMRGGGWQHTVGVELAGSTLGIVGFGRLGRSVAALGRMMRMEVFAWGRSLSAEEAREAGVRAVSLAELTAQSRFISIHLPLTDETVGLFGAAEIGQMRPDAFLINTSRGPIVDEDALVDALTNARIAGAGIDVYSTEPLPVEHPLRRAPRTLLLPHLGYVTRSNLELIYSDAVAAIAAWESGEPERVIRP